MMEDEGIINYNNKDRKFIDEEHGFNMPYNPLSTQDFRFDTQFDGNIICHAN